MRTFTVWFYTVNTVHCLGILNFTTAIMIFFSYYTYFYFLPAYWLPLATVSVCVIPPSLCLSVSLSRSLSFALIASQLTSKMNVMNMEQQLLLFITLSPQNLKQLKRSLVCFPFLLSSSSKTSCNPLHLTRHSSPRFFLQIMNWASRILFFVFYLFPLLTLFKAHFRSPLSHRHTLARTTLLVWDVFAPVDQRQDHVPEGRQREAQRGRAG